MRFQDCPTWSLPSSALACVRSSLTANHISKMVLPASKTAPKLDKFKNLHFKVGSRSAMKSTARA